MLNLFPALLLTAFSNSLLPMGALSHLAYLKLILPQMCTTTAWCCLGQKALLAPIAKSIPTSPSLAGHVTETWDCLSGTLHLVVWQASFAWMPCTSSLRVFLLCMVQMCCSSRPTGWMKNVPVAGGWRELSKMVCISLLRTAMGVNAASSSAVAVASSIQMGLFKVTLTMARASSTVRLI